MYKIDVLSEDYKMDAAKLMQCAYPGVYNGTNEEAKGIVKIFNDLWDFEKVIPIGAFEGERLVGYMNYYILSMNFHGKEIEMAGIGSVSVDMLNKKNKVAQNLIEHAIKRTRDNNISMFSLYPFNSKFYRNFGFGYGDQILLIKTSPKSFIDYGNKYILSYVDKEEYDMIFSYYDNESFKQHGMVKKTKLDKRRMLKNEKLKTIVAKRDGHILGYMSFDLEGISKENPLLQKMMIKDFFYSDREALKAFSSFINSQSDQVSYVELPTFDKNIHFIFDDVVYTPHPVQMPIIHHKYADAGIGLMYYATDTKMLLDVISSRTEFGIKFNITYPRNRTVEISYLNEKSNNIVSIDISSNDFSSWIMGVIGLKELYDHGCIYVDKPDVLRQLDYELNLAEPHCHTSF